MVRMQQRNGSLVAGLIQVGTADVINGRQLRVADHPREMP